MKFVCAALVVVALLAGGGCSGSSGSTKHTVGGATTDSSATSAGGGGLETPTSTIDRATAKASVAVLASTKVDVLVLVNHAVLEHRTVAVCEAAIKRLAGLSPTELFALAQSVPDPQLRDDLYEERHALDLVLTPCRAGRPVPARAVGRLERANKALALRLAQVRAAAR